MKSLGKPYDLGNEDEVIKIEFREQMPKGNTPYEILIETDTGKIRRYGYFRVD